MAFAIVAVRNGNRYDVVGPDTYEFIYGLNLPRLANI
jgi:hypothetical protein